MGVTGLAKLIDDVSPRAIHYVPNLKQLAGKVVAVDASMCLYQGLAALAAKPIGRVGHLRGTFYTNIRLLESGIKPVYVFDGKPPKLKSRTLKIRSHRREKAEVKLKEAQSAGDKETIVKCKKKLVKVNSQHVQETKVLLGMMGIPYVEAPEEAEAQCAALVQGGKVYATATEDMDSLTFGSNILLRHLTLKPNPKLPVQEIHLEKVLKGLKINMPEFIDLSILLGCDYFKGLRQVGRKRAFKLITKYRTLDGVFKSLKNVKLKVPEDFTYKEARKLFMNPKVISCDEIKLNWRPPDKDGITNYLCRERRFNEINVRKGVIKLLNLW